MEDGVLQEFVGRKVRVEEKEMTFTSQHMGEHKYMQYLVADDDETMHDLAVATAKSGLEVRTWLPDTMGTCDYRLDRLNVRITKGEDGSFSIRQVYLG